MYYDNNNVKRKLFTSEKIIIIYIIFITLLSPINNGNKPIVANITLKVKGPGTANILGSFFFNYVNKPDRIFINEIENTTINYSYYFEKIDNIVKLLWNNNSINDCYGMFQNCFNITEIDLSNFNTSNVRDMDYMFSDCSSLSSLDLSNFDTSNVQRMDFMFSYCSSLSSLDLSNFDISNVQLIFSLFSGFSKLEYINLSNFRVIGSYLVSRFFQEVPDNIVVCINETNNPNIFNQLKIKNCYTIDCSTDWKINQKRIVNKTDICWNNSNINILYKYEYRGLYYEDCINGDLINNVTIKKCKCDTQKCNECSNITLREDLCIECNNNNGYYEVESDYYLYGKQCYKNPDGYYLDGTKYKKCYYKCETCSINGDDTINNCNKCNNDYPIELKINGYLNCFEKCKYYYYFDNNNNYHCTSDFKCPDKYPQLSLDKKECTKINEIKDQLKDILKSEKKEENEEKGKEEEISEKKKEEEIKYYDTVIEQIDEIFTSENYDTNDLDKGKEEVIQTDKATFTLTTTDNQKNSLNENKTSINLGECETALRNHYNISDDEKLYIQKIDIVQEGLKIPKIEYEVYAKLNGDKLIKLNITVCQQIKIALLLPVEIKDNIKKYDSNSSYCSDKCYTSTSEEGVDITLKDRQNECANNSLCQEDCSFDSYNTTTKKVNCSCSVKERSKSFADMNINKGKLLANFKNIKNLANIGILSCTQKLFCKNGIIKNIAFYIIMIIILFHFIAIFIFCLKQYDSLNKIIKDIIFAIKNFKLLETKRKTRRKKSGNKKTKENNNDKLNNIINNELINQIDNNNEIIKDHNKISKKK